MNNKGPRSIIAVFLDIFAQTISFKSNNNPGVYTIYTKVVQLLNKRLIFFYFIVRCWPFDLQGT